MATASDVQIRIKVSSEGEVKHEVLMPYTSNVAALRTQIGQEGLGLVDRRTGNVLDDSVLLGALVDSLGEVHLEMLPMPVEVIQAQRSAPSGRRKMKRRASAKSVGSTSVSILAVIGGLAVAFVLWRLYSMYQTWRTAAKTEVIPANSPAAETASAPPSAASPAAASK
jgi:hypothetical protein